MAELLEVYDLEDNFVEVKERDKFYSEIKKEFSETGAISRKVKTVRVILLNSKGRIYLQKRSGIKNENAGLYDKTIGGHVAQGDTFDMTLVRECAEELGIPAAVLDLDEFEKSIHVTDLSVVGVFRKLDYIPNFQSIRITSDEGAIKQPCMTTLYMGYYDGAIRFIDGESSGVEVYSHDDLLVEMKDRPEKFTEDVKYIIKNYSSYIKPIRRQ